MRAVYSRQRHYARAAGEAEPIKIHFLISVAGNAIADARYRRGLAGGQNRRNGGRSMSRIEGMRKESRDTINAAGGALR
ncbi:hypothetical protein BCEP27_80354 [Burkholderia cepacia]